MVWFKLIIGRSQIELIRKCYFKNIIKSSIEAIVDGLELIDGKEWDEKGSNCELWNIWS